MEISRRRQNIMVTQETIHQKQKHFNVVTGQLPGVTGGLAQKSEKLANLMSKNSKLDRYVERIKNEREDITATIEGAKIDAKKGEEASQMGRLLNRAEKTLTHVGLEIQKQQGKLLKMKEERGNVRVDVEIEKRENEIFEMMTGRL